MVYMEYIFLIILILLIIINLQITKDIFHPTIIFKVVWFFSATILTIYKNKWGVELSPETIGIFLMGFISFDTGFAFFILMKESVKNRTKVRIFDNLSDIYNSIKFSRVILLFIITLIIAAYLIVDISRVIGGITHFFDNNFFKDYREMKYDGTDTTNIQQFLFRVIEGIGLATLIFLLREREDKTKSFRKILYLTIIFVSFSIQILTTGRMRFLAILVQGMMIFLVYSKRKGKLLNFKNQKKYLKITSLALLSFFSIFYLYGKFAVDKISTTDPFHSIAVYSSGSLAAFDMSWEMKQNTSEYFGATILSPIHNILNKLFNLDIGEEIDSGVSTFIRGDNDFATNVYTLYDKQILDFGVWLIPFVMFGIGLFIAYLKYKSESEIILGFWTGVYSLFMFSLVISFFQDTFFTNSTFTFISIIVYIIMFKTKLINSKKNQKPIP